MGKQINLEVRGRAIKDDIILMEPKILYNA
jgi:hypothetical protein